MNNFLNINNISLNFTHIEKIILSNINYQINRGDFVIILGSNGSGKSSLLKILDKRYSPTSGEILLNNKSINDYSNKDYNNKVITLTQNTNESLFSSLTVFENYLLAYQRQVRSLFRMQLKEQRKFFTSYIAQFNINLTFKLDQNVDSLSGGEKQALALALSILYPPEILLLDEHTSALDPKSAQQLMKLTHKKVSEHNITCILTTHDLDIAMQFGNRILALRNGELYQVIELQKKKGLSQKELLAACY